VIKQIQHGDILLKRIAVLPWRITPLPRRDGKIIVAEGEATGHNHVIESDKATLWVMEQDGETQLYLEVTEPVTITHDEHKPLPIPEGIYEIGRVKEYDYFSEMERRVVD
jgi:hypothetical protein